MDEEDTDVSIELADENHSDTEQAADDAARLLIEVRERRNVTTASVTDSDANRINSTEVIKPARQRLGDP